MKCRKAYGIMPVGENDRSAHVAQQKAPEVATPGLFYSVLGGWLNPKAGYQLFFSVQPFADVVGNYACQNGEDKRYCRIVHEGHPLSVPVSGVVAV